jgi:tRNA1Val (adenine37-N6)-methyltransferase
MRGIFALIKAMANNYFKFKQFTIYQDKCAMKVCTDACLFGALLPSITNGRALDIGTGTGLLSLMFAQKNGDAKVDAVEFDKDAFEQATTNLSASLWNNRLNLFLEDINLFKPEHQYDFIFSNPPFYENDLKSNDSKRNMAMHTVSLSYENLLSNVDRLLNNSGIFAVLLPFAAETKFIAQALSSNLFAVEVIRIKQTTKHSFFRTVIFFARESKQTATREIAIKDEMNNYTSNFTELLKDYYLFL